MYGCSDYGSADYNAGRMCVGAACELDGRSAKVIGASLDYAVIATLDPSGPAIEFSWSTVGRIMHRDRRFAA